MILTDSKVKAFGSALDDIVDWVKITKKPVLGRVLEMADGIVFTKGIGYLNENYSDKVPEKFVDDINDAVDCFINKKYSEFLPVASNVILHFGNIKQLNDDIEAKFIEINLKAAFEFAMYYANKKKVA